MLSTHILGKATGRLKSDVEIHGMRAPLKGIDDIVKDGTAGKQSSIKPQPAEQLHFAEGGGATILEALTLPVLEASRLLAPAGTPGG